MPQYQYQCRLHHTHLLYHPINECDVRRVCPKCGTEMHRVPQSIMVNWNGLPPHLEHSQVVKDFINTADARRDRYLANRSK